MESETEWTVKTTAPAPPGPDAIRRAVIDVGTNSVKLLIGDVIGRTVLPAGEQSEQTRLGRGFYDTNRLQPEAIAQTARAVAEFVALARKAGAVSIRLIATSAARDALNAMELVEAIDREAGLRAEIISGEQEAEYVFQGVATDPALADRRLLILDVGGGSTEFIVGERGHHQFRQSFPLGSVRLLERFKPNDPPSLSDLAGCRAWLLSFFQQQIYPPLELLLARASTGEVQLVGTGGTTTILARIQGQMTDFDRARIEGTILSRAEVLDQMVQLWSVSLADRKRIIGLPPNRADIIPMGVAILETVLQHFHFPDLRVSTRGLRFGALLASP